MKKTLLFTIAMLTAWLCMPASADDAEVTTVVEADFTTITQGSPEAPVAFASYGTGSFSTMYPSWMQSKVMQAGGQLLIPDGGYVRTPSKNMSANNGTVRITTRVRLMDATGGCVKFSVGYSKTQTIIIEDNEWHNLVVVMGGGSSSTYVRLEPFLSASGLLVQNLKVEQSAAFVAAPVALQPNAADGTSFTARWNSVTGATSYFLDVFTLGADGARQYLMQNEETTTTSKVVTGLDPASTYYFVVRASNGIGVSEDSNMIRVIKVLYYLETPQNVNVTTTTDSFTASWTPVTDASSYFVNVEATRTLTEAENVEMVNEDFSKISSGALDGIDFIISSYLDPYTQTPGWEGEELGKAVGYMVLTPLADDAVAFINTPLLDLADDNGNCTLNINMAQAAFGTFYPNGQVTVYVENAEGTQLSSQTVSMGDGFQDYTVNVTGGTSSCRVGISYVGNYKVFIDSMSITQQKPAGAQITTLFTEQETPDAILTCSVTNPLPNTLYSLTVTAAAETVRSTDIVPIYSDPSEAVTFRVGDPTGVESVCDDNQALTIYTLDGVVVKGTPAPGIYLIRQGNRVRKVVIK